MLGLVETKLQVVNKFDVVRIWGSDAVGWEFVGSIGMSGGLLLMWDELLFRMNNCYKGDRWLCVEGVLLKNEFNCAFCLVYGPHMRIEKLAVWEELSYIAGLCQVPICYMGDFNEVLQVDERKNQDRLSTSAEEFKSWIQDMQLVDLPLNDHKLKALTVPLGRWHKEKFGDLEKKIQHFEEEIKKVDDLVGNGVYDGTMEARRKALVSCCKQWYVRKEIHWKQMSRSRHAKDMDKNTRYFHSLASARRRNNRIDALMINGRLVRNQARIKIAIRDFYRELYHQERSPVIGFRDGLVNRIKEEESSALESIPSLVEIREAVWDCESSKAPGSDGYNMNFIKKCWDEIGTEFLTAVLDFFRSSRLPPDSNVTWVALALKFTGAKEIKDLRPISMVGCIYKVISKVMVRRMRSVMPGLVGETQSAFVKGRKIHDGALIACETVQWLKTRKKKAAIIKLDFQKAYDRVKWNFVDIVLQKMGFGRRWREWVRECIGSASMAILINGSPSKPFKMERGLRQGDSLSPFLFVLVVEVLHRMIGEAVRNRQISPLLVGKENIELSHLQFADDTILFCPPEEETVRNYARLLSIGPTTCVVFWGCKEANLLVRYLGIPLGANPRRVKTWKPIIDKVEEKLSLWKAKVLNKAGKLVLIKSVLNSLPVYYLSLYKMPKAVAEKLISLQRRFLWSKEEGRNGIALVKWEVVQAPKKEGGLGVGDAVIRNSALLFKWWWRFSKEECPLWKKVVCSCYDLKPNMMLSTQPLPTKGGPWKDICQLQLKDSNVRDKMITGLSMEVGDGRRTLFWEDVWLQGGSLKLRFPRLFSISNQQGSVIGDCGFWDGLEWVWNFQWRRGLYQWELELLNRLHEALRPINLASDKQDRLVWKYGKEGIFSTNSFVQVVQSETISEDITSFSFTRTIWKGVVNRNEERNRWLRCFFAVIWNIWLERNRRIFNSKEGDSEEVYQWSLTSYGEWSSRNLVVVDGNAGDDNRDS
ncbi:uncharacterized protein LOC107647403 [Arachis ipaensis]|uniref:uncharacterized protein LOC107647403 n=1 Tax=Arachis ipaensis TaxID=130454 RepID=UPI0007AFC59E|nr:uncharacterized protein LOC107647403 [Arachis ipaensis]